MTSFTGVNNDLSGFLAASVIENQIDLSFCSSVGTCGMPKARFTRGEVGCIQIPIGC